MPSIKRLVCLANSRKLHGRCVAGREWNGASAGRWIRPVSVRAGGAVSEYERQYSDGSDPQVLDLIDVPVLEPQPTDYQTENWLLDAARYWKKVGEFPASDLDALVETEAPLWVNGHSTYNGLNDKIPLAATDAVTDSLRLVHVNRLRLTVSASGQAFGNDKRRVRGRFRHADRDYGLWVTDPSVERTCLAKPDGTHEVGDRHLTVSLGEPFEGACYKLIAAILPPVDGRGTPAIENTVLTIGHSTHSVKEFVGLLSRHAVTALADVRATPYSRFNPQFNRESLAAGLRRCGIRYVFLGAELGGRSEDPSFYDDGRISYKRLSATRTFQEGLDRVERGATRYRIALMCAEGEPLECHRCLLIAPALEGRGVGVAHIRPDGALERQTDTMERLLEVHGMQDAVEGKQMFPRSRTDRVEAALARQAQRFGHRHQERPVDSVLPDRRHGELQS